ncbi:bile acid:sodium symporter family protein [Pontibacter sp. JAM-7]|uniref:bile acid:sodium symporter family protein n=1 Tax=Pontibacter sp. JAM-7 TaxID=3366581 RepID=UPI003AF7330D
MMSATSLIPVILPLALFCIMLGVGMSVELHAFRQTLQQPRLLLTGVLLQLIGLPILGGLVIWLFQLPPLLACGLMILTLAPGGATSNMITYLARGDTALSICLTAMAGIITPISLPLFSAMAIDFWLGDGSDFDFPVLQTMAKLALVSLLPALLGSALRHFYPDFCLRSAFAVKLITVLFMVLVVVGLVKQNGQQLLGLIPDLLWVLLSLLVLAMLLGWLIAKCQGRSQQSAVTLSIEVGIQNAAIALLLTAGILQNTEMAAVALFYGVLMNLPALLLIIWRNRLGLRWASA